MSYTIHMSLNDFDYSNTMTYINYDTSIFNNQVTSHQLENKDFMSLLYYEDKMLKLSLK